MTMLAQRPPAYPAPVPWYVPAYQWVPSLGTIVIVSVITWPVQPPPWCLPECLL